MHHHQPPLPQTNAALRLFATDLPVDPRALTLRQAYERWLEPDLFDAAYATRREYGTALNHWERLTGDPPIAAIANAHVLALRDGLLGSRYAPATVRKTWSHLRAILRRLSPQALGNPQGEGILQRVPCVKMPRLRPKLPRVATHAELDRLYVACSAAGWPPARSGQPAAALWRCFIVLAYNYGLRTRDLWGLWWKDIDFDRGLFRFSALKTSKLQGMPLNRVSRAHLAAIVPASGDDRPHVFHPTKSRHQFYREWAKINAAAEMSAPLECRDLRETCCTAYEEIAPGVGRWILAHSERGVTERHYLNPSRMVAEAVAKLPQPAAFLAVFEAEPAEPAERQLTLF
jgi:integrase